MADTYRGMVIIDGNPDAEFRREGMSCRKELTEGEWIQEGFKRLMFKYGITEREEFCAEVRRSDSQH